jgi:hypothetical protein
MCKNDEAFVTYFSDLDEVEVEKLQLSHQYQQDQASYEAWLSSEQQEEEQDKQF